MPNSAGRSGDHHLTALSRAIRKTQDAPLFVVNTNPRGRSLQRLKGAIAPPQKDLGRTCIIPGIKVAMPGEVLSEYQ